MSVVMAAVIDRRLKSVLMFRNSAVTPAVAAAV